MRPRPTPTDLIGELQNEIAEVLRARGIEIYSELGIAAVLGAMGSPFKWGLGQEDSLLAHASLTAYKAYSQSRIAMDVALLGRSEDAKADRLMKDIARALARHEGPLSEELLLRDTLRVHLRRPDLRLSGVPEVFASESSLKPAFDAARRRLHEGGVIEPTPDGNGWALEGWLSYETHTEGL